ncbi:helicase-exonuclease AddAB subunit AddA [Acetobacterium sp.]|uniref:helicase-exonuclease AddAB subunit AddA n=1 Tax=Acetobacterium sp. TaxID=1872094 RepID=UPI002F41B75E
MKWTSDQLEAIEIREKNMLVSAAAGSGKTALLIERIIRIILEEKVGVDELLVLTFTRGAAGEMKNRLSQALAKALSDPANDRQFLLKQMNILGGAAISTLHSFCLGILRQYFQKGDIDPGFMVGNETEIALMLKETLEEIFEAEYLQAQNNKEAPFITLVEKYSGNRNDQGLKDIVECFYRFLVTQPDPEGWCEKSLSMFSCDRENFWTTVWGESLLVVINAELTGARDYAKKAELIAGYFPGFETTHEQMARELSAIEDIRALMKSDFPMGLKALENLKYEKYKGSTKIDKAMSDTINKEYRTKSKSIVVDLQKRFLTDMDTRMTELNNLRETMGDLVDLTQKFRVAFREKKGKKNLLDFNDLEQFTLKILKDPMVAQEVQAKYRYVFLDEYQDTNEMQETILQCVVRENNYFMVGDVKQSIYRFRLADPTIFIKKYDAFSQVEEAENALVTLSKNFRSAQGVIDGVNAIFQGIMSPKLGEIDYDHRAMLYKGLSHEGPYVKTEIHLLNIKDAFQEPSEIDGEILEDMTDVEMEARFVAGKIQSLVGTSFFDTRQNKERMITYRDFGILMRSAAGRGDVYLKVFSELGIPAYFDGGANYYESLEINMILNLLNLMDNQHQDLPLLSVMTSPIGGFTTKECTMLRIIQPEGFYYGAVEAYGKDETDSLSEKIRNFYKKLNDWRDDSKIMPIEDFLWKIYLESGYYAFAGALPGGEQRQCNLRILLKRAGDYKKSTLRGLYQFIRFVENMKKHKQDISPPGILSNADAVVRIMTIHKSKGLEFPIVFLTGTGKRFNKQSNNNQILFHKDLGICPDYVDLEKRFKRNSLAKEVCKSQSNMEMLSEEMRLLYVAMTRAEEKLYIVGTVKKLENEVFKWLEAPDDYQLLKASGLLHWVMLGAIGGKDLEELPPVLSLDHFMVYRHGDITETPELGVEIHEELPVEIPEETDIKAPDPEKREAIFRRLNYQYPEKMDNALPSKMSVTEIKNVRNQDAKNENDIELKKMPQRIERPKFLEKEQDDFTATQRGSALHLLMETVNLKPIQKRLGAQGSQDLQAYIKKHLLTEVERLIQEEFLPEKLARAIDLSRLVAFYSSNLGIRLLAAKKIKREIPFNFCYDPGNVRDEWAKVDGKIMVQGIIDCAFIEDGQWVLIDYKTDYYKDARARDAIIRGYKIQVDLYAQALETLTGIKVKEKIIALITMKENIRL